ncbi:MAG: DUF2029 domain-containing protein [Methanomicrobiales archaeon]|nr:DUF2029 domain-containing protein [Methanomicrobiales archaeon]
MPVNKRRILDSFLILLSFLIPLNCYIIWHWLGLGLQFCFLRYQDTYAGPSLIPLFRELSFVTYLDWGFRSSFSFIAWVAAALVLISVAILHLFQHDILTLLGTRYTPRYRKWIGIHFALAALFILISVVFQYGPLLHGSAGTAIPIGIPLFLTYAWYFWATPLESPGSVEPGTAGGKRPWMRVAAYLVVIVTAVFFVLNEVLVGFLYSGWDFRIYCAAVYAYQAGLNPYDLGVLARFTPYLPGVSDIIGVFVYPPLTLLFFEPLCSTFSNISSLRLYFFLYAVILLLGIYLVWRLPLEGHDPFYAVILYSTGLISLFWSIGTGNISILYGPLSVLIFYFLIQKRYLYSAVCTALLSAFNLFPIIFLSVYAVLPVTIRDKAKILTVGLGAFVLWLLASFLWNPNLFLLYVAQLRGGESPVHEIGGFTTPTAYTFLVDVLNQLGIDSPAIILAVIILFMCVILGLFARYSLRNKENALMIFCYGFIAVFLLLPRLKCNYFVFILVPLYILTRYSSLTAKTGFLVIVSLVPAVLSIFWNFFIAKADIWDILFSYNQVICSFIAFVVIWLLDERQGDRAESSLQESGEGA